MTSINQEIVEVKINLMLKYLNRLRLFDSLTFNEYLDNFDQQLIAERLLQLLIELASDINSYLLVEIYQVTPQTYFDSFVEAGNNGIINPVLATELAPASGLRNRLVHQYEEINSRIVFESISDALRQFPLYIREITNYLKSLEAEDG